MKIFRRAEIERIAECARGQFIRLFGGDSSLAECFAVMPCLIWAAVLFEPNCTFCSGTAFGPMRFMSEDAWAWIFLTFATVACAAWWFRLNWLRCRLMQISVLWWFYIARLLMEGNPAGVGIVHVMFGFAGLVAYVQIPGGRRGIR